ncbi:MAG: alkaline phosphatase family protein [Alphaproteobacteria bacterium]|nr:alkaline phosphatase family protein [Alphaproteobacteria bacterium]
MSKRNRTKGLAFAFAGFSALVAAPPSEAEQHHHLDGIKHVLLISIDGFHAVDLATCTAAGTCPNLERLTDHGSTYTHASTTKPSDSFPGLLAQLTGGTSLTTGVFYDDSYDRTFFAPGSNCAGTPGTEMNYAESLDINQHSIDGGIPQALTGLNSAVAIDPTHLVERLVNGVCKVVWPHNIVRANTIFDVIHAHHLRTAWSDKHPAYDIINGNRPFSQPEGGPGTNVDDFFAPEINSDLSDANVKLIASLGLHSTAPRPATDPKCPGPKCGSDFTSSIDGVEFYDGIKVQAVLNEINGFDHTGKIRYGAPPAIFGMNFQAVSVGQKLKIGGYTDTTGTPSANLANTIAFVDRSIGAMVDGLQDRGLARSTLIIISAKHGQSPIDRSKRQALDDSTVIAGPIGANFAFSIDDDGALIWLKDNSGSKTAAAVAALEGFSGDTGIVEWLSGPLLTLFFQNPATDSRTPDIIGIARTGVIYTGGSKIAEHGGFNEDDTHVALIVSHPDFDSERVSTAVTTTQIAPTILQVLGLDPNDLEAVRAENTPVLPDFN